jgi:hypothetical protein
MAEPAVMMTISSVGNQSEADLLSDSSTGRSWPDAEFSATRTADREWFVTAG